MHILSPETDNCPSWICGRERMTVENSSWSISTKECCRPRRGLNPRPPGLQSDGASNWATEATDLDCLLLSNYNRHSFQLATKCTVFITKTRLFKYVENFTTKNWKFSDKNSDTFHMSAQNINCGYSLEPPRRGGLTSTHNLFLSRNKKHNVYPCKPSFTIQKLGLRGSKLYRRVFVMA